MVYISATGGNPGLGAGGNNPAIALMAALGACGNLNASSFININEVTTVGAVWALQRFMTSTTNVGGPAGSIDLQNAFVNSAMLVDTASGSAQSAATIGDPTVRTINTIADALAACVNTDGSTGASTNCGKLFSATTPPAGSAPANTIAAALDLALNPNLDGTPIMSLVPAMAPFQPVATAAPQDWSLGFVYPGPTTFPANLNSPSVFIGDSITANWPLPMHNQGVNSQYAADVMVKMQAGGVLGLGYSRVIILAGTNDVLAPIATSPNAINTIKSMANLARTNGMQPVLCLLLPMHPDSGDLNPQVNVFNASLTSMAAMGGFLLVDYNTPLQGHYPDDFHDGVHPNADGYALMETALSSVVTR
jgi:lysophospholipase L1-like esterase